MKRVKTIYSRMIPQKKTKELTAPVYSLIMNLSGRFSVKIKFQGFNFFMKKFLAFRIICAFIVISVLAPLLLSCSLKADNSQTDNQPSENKEPSQNNAPPDVDNDSDKGGNSTGDDNSGDNTGADTENGNPNDNSEPEKEPPDKPLTTSEILQTLLNGEYNRDDVNLTSNKNSELEVSFYDEMAFGQNGFSLLNFNNNSKILKNNCFFETFLRSIINIHQNNSENLSYVTLISNVLELYPNFENSYISESQFPENAILLDIMSPHLSKLTAQNISYEIKIPIYYGCQIRNGIRRRRQSFGK